jgi:hypothetical protein
VTRVFVALDAIAADEYAFQNSAMAGVLDKMRLFLAQYPFVTYGAIEGAWMSGVFHAKHRLKRKAFKVELLSFGFEGDVENATPFAVATTVAIYNAIGGISDYSDKDLPTEWSVTKVELL